MFIFQKINQSIRKPSETEVQYVKVVVAPNIDVIPSFVTTEEKVSLIFFLANVCPRHNLVFSADTNTLVRFKFQGTVLKSLMASLTGATLPCEFVGRNSNNGIPKSATLKKKEQIPLKKSFSVSASAADDLSRREILTNGATLTAALAAATVVEPSFAETPISEWEQVPLPIDPGVVLLDISFVPDEPNRGVADILCLAIRDVKMKLFPMVFVLEIRFFAWNSPNSVRD